MQFTGRAARETGMGGHAAPFGATPRRVDYQGRRVELLIARNVNQELSRLALDGVTTDRLMRALEVVAIYESNVPGIINVTTQTVARLEAVITTQMGRRVSRSQAVENIIGTPNNFLTAPAQSRREEFPARPAREGGRRDPFHPGGRGQCSYMGGR